MRILCRILFSVTPFNLAFALRSPSQESVSLKGQKVDLKLNQFDSIAPFRNYSGGVRNRSHSDHPLPATADGLPIDGHGSVYIVNLTIAGTDYPVIFDTGSSSTWVHRFQPAPNYTRLNGDFEVVYGSGEKNTGALWSGDIHLNNLTVPSATFGSAEEATFQVHVGGGNEKIALGILGMGPQSRTDSFHGGIWRGRSYESFWRKASRELPKDLFTVDLDREASEDVEFTFGAVPHDLAGPILWAPLVKGAEDSPWWTVNVEGIIVKGTHHHSKRQLWYLDTGSSHIFVSEELLAGYLQKVKSWAKHDSLVAVDCSERLPSLTLILKDGGDVTIHGQHLMGKRMKDRAGMCELMMVSDPSLNTPKTILGQPFFWSHVVVFDREKRRTGFLPHKP